jgi:hypothetical protein
MKITKIVFIIIIGFILSPQLNAHPFYVSICQVDYNQQNQSIEISLKVFANDLILGLEGIGVLKLYLGELSEHEKADAYLETYLKEVLSIKIDKKNVNLRFIGKELEKDVVWCYLEVENIKGFSEIEVTNKLLTEIFETQSNIIHIKKDGEIRSLLLGKQKPTDSIVF